MKEIMMKKIYLSLLFCVTSVLMANAQKFALIDMEYILENGAFPEKSKR